MKFKVREGQDKSTAIVDRITRKLLGRFKDGVFETSNEKLIARLKPHYEVVVENKKKR
jgi:hypothetical protein